MDVDVKTRERNQGARVRVAVALCAVALAVGVAASVVVLRPSGAIARKRLEKSFRKVADARAGDPFVVECKRRVALIDEVGEAVLDCLATLGELRSDETDYDGATYLVGSPDASDLLRKYESEFAFEPTEPEDAPEEIEILLQYCDSRAALAEKRVVERGREMVEAGEAEPADVVPLCLLMPLLCIDDTDWTPETCSNLPKWLRRPTQLDHAEWFLLVIERPLTAYEFAALRSRANGTDEPGITSYLSESGKRLVRAGEFGAGIHCLRVGASISERHGDNRVSAAMRFQIADVFDQIGQTLPAAEEMKTLLEGPCEDADWARAAVLRLKLLFKALEYARVVEEVDAYRTNPKAGTSLPSLNYVKWLAQVRQDDVDGALKTRNDFLARFPQHILAADIYFAVAMEHLSKGDYEEALKLLEFITEAFPEARVTARSESLIERLRTTVHKEE